MNYQEWLAAVPAEITGDRLWQWEVYRLALFLGDLASEDTRRLAEDRRLLGLADQLYRAAGSISANVAEGYSHRSGKDQARFYEYALGSARETRNWYYLARRSLPAAVIEHRLALLTAIIRSLLTIIPAERGYKMHDEPASYDTLSDDLANPPQP